MEIISEPDWGKISRFEICTVMERDGSVQRVAGHYDLVAAQDTPDDRVKFYYTLYEIHDPELDDGFGGAMALVNAPFHQIVQLHDLMHRWAEILRAYKRMT